jgi:hypothetical protein
MYMMIIPPGATAVEMSPNDTGTATGPESQVSQAKE